MSEAAAAAGTIAYRAIAYRDGDWWTVEVDDLGATQSPTPGGCEDAARALVADMLDAPLDDIEVEVLWRVTAREVATLDIVANATSRATGSAAFSRWLTRTSPGLDLWRARAVTPMLITEMSGADPALSALVRWHQWGDEHPLPAQPPGEDADPAQGTHGRRRLK